MRVFVNRYCPRITEQEIALLDLLSQIDCRAFEITTYPALCESLIKYLLVEKHNHQFRLTTAGIDRLHSLKHCLAEDLAAKRFFEAFVSQLMDS